MVFFHFILAVFLRCKSGIVKCIGSDPITFVFFLSRIICNFYNVCLSSCQAFNQGKHVATQVSNIYM